MTTVELAKIGGPLVQYNPTLLVEYRIAVIYQLRQDLLWLHYKDQSLVEAEDIQQLIDFNKNYPHEHRLIITLGEAVDITKEGREVHEAGIITLQKKAVVSTSLAHRILINYVIGKQAYDFPQQLFNNLEEAIQWLEED